jgi:large subunit ribosomal protein L16
VKPGRILYEMEGVNDEIARKAFRLASFKMPISTEVIHRAVQAL